MIKLKISKSDFGMFGSSLNLPLNCKNRSVKTGRGIDCDPFFKFSASMTPNVAFKMYSMRLNFTRNIQKLQTYIDQLHDFAKDVQIASDGFDFVHFGRIGFKRFDIKTKRVCKITIRVKLPYSYAVFIVCQIERSGLV